MIALCDSGAGGLTVLAKIRAVYKGPVLYLGDLLNSPYGSKDTEFIAARIKAMLMYAKKRGATHFVSACNSISVTMTDALLESAGIDKNAYTDMVRATTLYGKDIPMESLLVLATEATVRAQVYSKLFTHVGLVSEFALPHLATAIERGNETEMEDSVFMLESFSFKPSHVFLGCTHYPLARNFFERIYPGAAIVDPAEYVAKVVASWNCAGEGATTYVLTRDSQQFEKIATSLGLFTGATKEIAEIV